MNQEPKVEPIKNCSTCGHANKKNWCVLTGFYCSTQRQLPTPPCDINLSGWVAATPAPPAKPKRSLRRWLYETLWE